MLLLLSREPATLSTIQQFFEFGVIHAETNIPTRFIGISDFTHNSRKSGGAIYAADNVVLFSMELPISSRTQQTGIVVVQSVQKITHH